MAEVLGVILGLLSVEILLEQSKVAFLTLGSYPLQLFQPLMEFLMQG